MNPLPDNSMELARQYVADGAALLDQKRGSTWRQEIDFDTLDLDDITTCILGQLYGNYFEGKHVLGIIDGANYGFDRNPFECTWTQLEQAWKEECNDVQVS